MTKDEQIKELAECIFKSKIAIDGIDFAFGLYGNDTHFHRIAKILYDNGYRKVSKNYAGTDEVLRSIDYRPTEEVRKETAKEILSDIYFNLKISAKEEPKSNDYYNVLGWIEEIAKEYGVEVE